MVAPSEARGSTLQGRHGDWKPKGISGLHGRANRRAERLKKGGGEVGPKKWLASIAQPILGKELKKLRE